MQSQIKRLTLYIAIKWAILSIFSFYIFLGVTFNFLPLGFLGNASYFLILLLAVLNNIALTFAIKNNNLAFAHPSLFFDLFLLVFTSYIGGGIENPWLFLPALIIISVGYLFGLGAALIYATIAFLSILGIYLLEFFSLIPHFSAFGFPTGWWRNISYGIDYMVGMFILYFFAAAASGYFKKNMEQTSIHLEKSLISTKIAQKDSEDSRQAMQNITEDLIAAKKALEEDMIKLKAIDRMKTEFLSMVSHELCSPMTPIKGYLALLLKGDLGKLTPESEKAINILAKQSDHLHTLIDSLLDLSRLELGKPIPAIKEPINMQTIVQDVAAAMELQAEAKKQGLKVKIGKNLPTILGDSTKIKRVLINLIGNAMKFTPQEGKIEIQAFQNDSKIQIEVFDTGIGLSAENLEKIFEKFFQVDSSVTRTAGGMGLGLALAWELVELHGGQLWVESEGLGKGSKFIFTLPIEQK